MLKKPVLIITLSAAVLAILDAILKYIAINRPLNEGRLSFLLDFSLHKNPGIAFDIPIPLWIVITITSIVIVILIALIIKRIKTDPLLSSGAFVIVCGALGNMIDRIINGFTTDYLILFQTSAINISDILIVTGVLMVLWYNTDKDGANN